MLCPFVPCVVSAMIVAFCFDKSRPKNENVATSFARQRTRCSRTRIIYCVRTQTYSNSSSIYQLGAALRLPNTEKKPAAAAGQDTYRPTTGHLILHHNT